MFFTGVIIYKILKIFGIKFFLLPSYNIEKHFGKLREKFMKNMELLIDEKARRYAKIYSSLIKDEYQRKRANAAIAVLCAYSSFLKKTTDFDIQDSMTIYRNPLFCSRFETADFYAEGFHIDVRVTLDENLILVPKIHYDNNIIPDFYAAVKIDKDINTAVLLGIADTSKTSPKPFNSLYYSIDASELISSKDFINRLRTPKTADFTAAEHENFKENYLKFIDDEIKGQKRIEILKHLFECSECRTEFCCFTGFEMVNRNAAKYPDLINEKAFETIQKPEEYKDEPEAQKTEFESSRRPQGFNASSAMTENDLKDETQMGYVPYTDFTPPKKEKEAEQASELQLIDDSGAENIDIFREFAGIEGDKMPEMETIQKHEIFESIPEGVEIKPAEMQLISDDEIASDAEDMALIDKDSSDDLIYEENSIDGGIESEMLNIDDNLNYGNNSAEDGGLSIKEEEQDIRLNLDINDLRDESDKIQADELPQIVEDAAEQNLGADIMDQMFVDGSLESELQEQEEVSYSNIESPAYTGLNQQENNAEIIEKVIEEDDNSYASAAGSSFDNKEQQTAPPQKQEKQAQTESEEDMLQQTEDDNINEIILKAESEDFYGGEEIKEETDEAAQEKMMPEAAEAPAVNENIKENEIEETKTGYKEAPAEEKQEEENDELLSMLPSEKEKETERTFSGNLDSELPEGRVQNYPEYSDADEEEEEDDDDDEYEDEDEEEYEEYEDEDDGGAPGISSRRTSEPSLKNMIITVSALAVLLAACGAGAFMYIKNRNTSSSEAPQVKASSVSKKQNTKDMFNKPVKPSGKDTAAAPKPASPVKKIALSTETAKAQQNQAAAQGSEEQNINKAIAKALAEGPAAVTLKGVNWYAAPELVSDKAFKKYMQDIDNTLRMNLKNNLIKVKEVPPQNQITAKFAVDNNRNLRKVLITESSGSDAADKVVLQSLNETFKGLKSPILTDSPLKADMYFFKIVINL